MAQSIVICESIFNMLRKYAETSWTEDCQKAFDKIKEYLFTPPVLVLPELGRPLLLYLSKPMPTGKLAKWQILLSEFNIVYITRKMVKGQALADHLAENPVGGEYEPLKIYFPDEGVSFVGEEITEAYNGWRMFFDGAANFKGVGIGAVLTLSNIVLFVDSEFPSPLLMIMLPINSDLMKAMCETFQIKHKNSTACRPQMNGAIEAANKNIKKILRKMVENHKQWHDKLPFALLGYCTTVHTSIGATPYMLVYGTEVVIQAEVEIPSLMIIQEAELSNAK
ncbi:uncharacterized protein [Nicotiana sylvestris]|uniref:uncharacterized protein n=1 Tax=Nicotiana sylvestris TaxID=4096 RepID=UPI00388C4C1F